MGLDYNKAKRRAAGRHGEPLAFRETWNTGNWRTEYPEEFPVTVLRPIDYNGHVPDEDAEVDQQADESEQEVAA